MIDEIKANRRKSEEKSARREFDVFLSYNSNNREQVITVSNWLKDNGLAPWLYEWEIRPGLPWMPLLEEQIEQTSSAAIFVGKEGLGPWQEMERQMLLGEMVKRGCPVIPVLLEDVSGDFKLPGFLKGNTWVDFRQKNPDPLRQLIFGITGQHPKKVYRPGVLLASLGDSPAVIPAIYDLLTQQKGLTFDRVVVLHPMGQDIRDAYTLVRDALSNDVLIESDPLDFEDADSEQRAYAFLQHLYKLLSHYERQEESVYLSLAGGRKSMAALIAWVVPFFSCIKGLYHVIDKEEDHFPLLYEIVLMSSARRAQAMRPKLDQLLLVDIPWKSGQQISHALLKQLLGDLPDDFEQAEAIIMGRSIIQDNGSPKVLVTEMAFQQFQEMCRLNILLAQKVHKKLLAMHQWATLQTWADEDETYAYKAPKFPRIVLRSPTAFPSSIHPVFYTLPVSDSHEDPIEQIVICSLEEVSSGGYRTLKEVTKTPNFSLRFRGELPTVPFPAESILIVPLGKSPMVATQIYTLLKEREQRTIHEVVLLYPGLSAEIKNAADLVKEALQAEGDTVLCTLAFIPGLADIVRESDCEKYQQSLEDEIIRIRQTYPDCKIDLALSGGRKGMTAMTIFAAQKKQIPYVYHTLITDDRLSEKIEAQTTVAALKRTSLSLQEHYDRLFLRDPDYREGEMYPYEKFVLFRVPVFSPDG
jgi:CRISPR-associated Csx14 family protein